jgi:hypothetical protein
MNDLTTAEVNQTVAALEARVLQLRHWTDQTTGELHDLIKGELVAAEGARQKLHSQLFATHWTVTNKGTLSFDVTESENRALWGDR